MANIYARETALKNVVGRSDYISNPTRQESIVLHKKNMGNTWEDYATFEAENQKSKNGNIEARETVVALPNDLSKNPKELEKFCDALGMKLFGQNRDYEYAVHWNESHTNLHVHFIYSERERNTERQPKRYKRDIWADKKTGRTCKKDTPNAVLRCKKGDIMKDKDGNIRYDDSPFSVKDKKYNNKNWLDERNKLIQGVFRQFKREIYLFNPNTRVAQKKLYKGAQDDYIEFAKNWNKEAKKINQERANQLRPLLKEQKTLKPLIDELQSFDTKEINEAELRLNIYQKDGYSGNHWGPLKRITYLASQKYADETNVELYKNSVDKVSNVINKNRYPSDYVRNFVKYFKDIAIRIRNVQDQFFNKKATLTQSSGTIERLKHTKQLEIDKQNKEKELLKEKNKQIRQSLNRSKTRNTARDDDLSL